MLHRQIRAGKLKLRIRPVPTASIGWEKLDGNELKAIEIPALERSGLLTVDRPLDIRVRESRDRARIDTVVCHSTTRPLPGGSFVELVASRLNQDLLPPRSSCRMLMDGVALTILDVAGELSSYVRRGKMSRDEAVMSLVALVCEFCGTYARDYNDPWKGEVTFELASATTVEEVRAYLRGAQGYPGIGLVRDAVQLSVNGLASPMELLLYAALAFPPRMGGLHIKKLRVNEPLDLSGAQVGTLAHHRLTPDIRVGDDPVAVEYNGKEHLEKYRVRQDKNRAQDYAKLGITHYPLMSDDFQSIDALDRTLHSLVDLLSPYEGKGFRKRALRILHDREYRDARRRLLVLYLR